MKSILFNFNPYEYKKMLNLLEKYRLKGYVVTKIDCDSNKVYFEKTDKQYIYGIDYNNLYPAYSWFFNEERERFDNARLDGWQLCCYDNGIGIWINENINAVPFFENEEYQKIENNQRKEFIKELKNLAFWLIITIIVCSLVSLRLYPQKQVVLQMIVMSVIAGVFLLNIYHKRFISKRVMVDMKLCYIIACFGEMNLWCCLYLVLGMFDLTRDNPFLLKNQTFLYFYELILTLIMFII